MKKNLLSICCLGYNHGKFITDNIQAIWKSDYKDIEIIVVDDGSSDNSDEILKELQSKSPYPMKVILQKNTGNVGHNLNVALEQATGQYITFMSLDDVLNSANISKALNILIENSQIAFVAASTITGIDRDGKICDNVPPLKLNSINQPTVSDLLELEYTDFHTFYIQGTFFRKEIIDAVGGFDEDMTGDDIVLRTKVFRYLLKNPEWNFKIISEPLASYRQHDSNIHLNTLRQMKIVSEYLERYWPDRKNPPIFTSWAKDTLLNIPKEKWINFFSLNKRTLSCLFEEGILDLLLEKQMQNMATKYEEQIQNMATKYEEQKILHNFEISLLLNESKIRNRYVRYKLCSKIIFGKNRKHYKKNVKIYREKLKKIHQLKKFYVFIEK